MVTRSRRYTRTTAAPASVTISRSQSYSPEEPGCRLRLIVKMPAGKLREATGGRPARRSVNVFQENPIVSGTRSSRNKKKVVEVPSDEDDIEDQEEDEVEDDEDADADGDLDMDDAPPQPPARRNAKAALPPRGKNVKSVEAKEMELDDEEEEEMEEEAEDDNVSETDSDIEGEPDDMDESAVPDVNVDDLDEEDEEDDLDDELDSDALALDGGKQTKRQRGNLGDDFLQLPMGKYIPLSNPNKILTGETEPQVKKHLTAEERAMRRAEMARRRKNLSEKRNEEEKVNFSFISPTLLLYSLIEELLFLTVHRWIRSTVCSGNSPQNDGAEVPPSVRTPPTQPPPTKRASSPKRPILSWSDGSAAQTVARSACPWNGSALQPAVCLGLHPQLKVAS